MYNNPYQSPYPYRQPESPELLFAAEQRKREKRHVKKLSWGAAAATGGFFLLANILYGIYYLIPGIQSAAQGDADIILLSVDMLITMISLLLPFGIVYFLNTKKLGARPMDLQAPHVCASTALLFIIGGSGMLLASSYITSYISAAFESLTGITFYYTFFDTPTSALGLVVFYARSAVMPALAEEFAMRGVVMQPLRRYGDLFALLMSSMVFALMHGNMVQAPFAFLAGMILGYAVIRTGSLWTSILIHCINNAFSVTISVVNDNISEAAASVVSVVGSAVLIGAGAIAVAMLYKRGELHRPAANVSFLPSKICFRTYILSVPMLLVLAYMLFQTALMVDLPDVSDLSDLFSSLLP